MAHYAGNAGSVAIGADAGTAQSGIKSWTLDYTLSVVDTTDFADAGTRSILPSVSQWSGSFEGYKDVFATTPVLGVSTTAVNLVLKETATTTQRYSGSAFITGVHANVSYDGVVSYSFDFEGTGALTVPTT